MSLQACADIVQKGDPDRFAAAMAAPVAARRVLFPLYAFNAEVARAPWVASEPMIGEMRLQWWRDALEEIAEGKAVRKHEVTTPLAEALSPEQAARLDASVAARRWDLYIEAFEDAEHFSSYLRNTGGLLMAVAAQALGAGDASDEAIVAFGSSTALARFLVAVPELEARGRIPLVDGRLEAIADLARTGLAQGPKPKLSGAPRAAMIEGWQTRALLKQVVQSPGRVAEGALALSEFRKRFGLIAASFS